MKEKFVKFVKQYPFFKNDSDEMIEKYFSLFYPNNMIVLQNDAGEIEGMVDFDKSYDGKILAIYNLIAVRTCVFKSLCRIVKKDNKLAQVLKIYKHKFGVWRTYKIRRGSWVQV